MLASTYRIAAPVEHVWPRIHDYPTRLDWDVFVRRIVVHGEPPVRVGTELTQHARWRSGGVRMRVRYVRCDPPRAATVEMLGGPWFMRRFVAAFELEPDGAGTLVRSEYHVTWRPSCLGWLLAPIAGRIFVRESHARWASLAALCTREAATP